MKLIYCDYEDCWVWADKLDYNDELSPRFDEKEDAQNWYYKMNKFFKKELT